ncbi:tandem-95_repeat protein [Hexamita inflata]|uniref:Tandem-95 repeat protein n=1 Tax=Hexamita inflata TaxID=28002 RepID=A0AA86RAA4_9EUKA|nr:tandem-95 repeat protein [Hexamita inflata]
MISDISVMQNLKNLQRLNVANNKLQNISAVQCLQELLFLDASFNQISDLSPVYGLNNLIELVVEGNCIKSIEPVQQLKQLSRLCCSSNPIQTDLLQNIQQVIQLQLQNVCNNTNYLLCLRQFINIQVLDISQNNLDDISMLEKLVNLEQLDVSDNQISSLNSLSQLTNLMWLDASNNLLEDILGLEDIINDLSYLNLTGNKMNMYDLICRNKQLLVNSLCSLNLSSIPLSKKDFKMIIKFTSLKSLILSLVVKQVTIHLLTIKNFKKLKQVLIIKITQTYMNFQI